MEYMEYMEYNLTFGHSESTSGFHDAFRHQYVCPVTTMIFVVLAYILDMGH